VILLSHRQIQSPWMFNLKYLLEINRATRKRIKNRSSKQIILYKWGQKEFQGPIYSATPLYICVEKARKKYRLILPYRLLYYLTLFTQNKKRILLAGICVIFVFRYVIVTFPMLCTSYNVLYYVIFLYAKILLFLLLDGAALY
jgi:hypothetical protein